MAITALIPVASNVLEIGGGLFDELGDLFGGNPRSGGADPCCPPGYDPSGVWPRNSGVQGAPPDYRTPGSPFGNPSPSGEGRLKDDFCDCVPINVGGRLWVLGEVRDGKVYTGAPQNRDAAVWVEVDRNGRPLSVPGVGMVPAPASTPATTGQVNVPPFTATTTQHTTQTLTVPGEAPAVSAQAPGLTGLLAGTGVTPLQLGLGVVSLLILLRGR